MNITNSQIVYNIRFSSSQILDPGSDAYDWILQNGIWDDNGIWKDTSQWKDN